MTEIGAMKTAIPSQFADLIVGSLIGGCDREGIALSADLSLILQFSFFFMAVDALRLLAKLYFFIDR